MIIFPFGFYILEGKRPVYVGNDLEAQKTVLSWIETSPEIVRLAFDMVGPTHILTKFLGWNPTPRSKTMDQTPLLFEATLGGGGLAAIRQLYSDYDAALAGHDHLVEIARKKLH